MCLVAQRCLWHLIRCPGHSWHSKTICQKDECTNDLTNEEKNQTEAAAGWSHPIQPPIRSLFMCLIYHQSTYFSRMTSVASPRQWVLWSSLRTNPHLQEWCKLEIMLLILNNWHKTNFGNRIHLTWEIPPNKTIKGRTRPESKGICRMKLGRPVLFPSDYFHILPVKSNFLKWPLFIRNYLV